MKHHTSAAHVERIRKAATLDEARQLGFSSAGTFRKDWEEVKEEVMLTGVRYKFDQNAEARGKLLATAGSDLLQWCEDGYWGVGRKGHGKNTFGKILMRVRDELNQKI